MKPLLIYCYDAYCSWCYGFSPTIRKIAERYANRVSFEVLSGTIIDDENPVPIHLISPFFLKAYKEVEEKTGIQFGSDFLWHIKNPNQSDWIIHSKKAAIALCILKDLRPADTLNLAADLQTALFSEGRDLTDPEAYRHLLLQYDIDPSFFYEALNNEEYRRIAKQESQFIQDLHIEGFPTLLLQIDEKTIHLVSHGFESNDDISRRLDDLLQQSDID